MTETTRPREARAFLKTLAGLLPMLVALLLAGCGGGAAESGPEGSGEGGGEQGGAAKDTRAEQEALADRYEGLDTELRSRSGELNKHKEILNAPHPERPEDRIRELVGPEAPETSEKCERAAVSCEVNALSKRAARDRKEFEKASDSSNVFSDKGSGPSSACRTTQTSYYEKYELSATDTATRYREVRDEMLGAAEAVPDAAPAARELVPQVRGAHEASKAVGRTPDSANISPQLENVEQSANEAEDLASGVPDAVAEAEEIYAASESKTEEIAAEAVALRESAGCSYR